MRLNNGTSVKSKTLTSTNLTFSELILRLADTPFPVVTTNSSLSGYLEWKETDKPRALKTKDSGKGYIIAADCDPLIRNSKNIKSINLIVLDVDEDITKPFSPPDNFPYSYIFYTTLSHSPKLNRHCYRLIVDTDQTVLPCNYKRAVEHLCTTYNIPASATAFSATQPMLLPHVFLDNRSSYAIESKTLKPLTQSDIPNLINIPEGADTPNSVQEDYSPKKDTFFEVPKAAIDALKLLTPKYAEECSRQDWLEVGMALHHVSGGSNQASDLFANFSAEWAGFQSTEDCEEVFDSLESNRGLSNITIKTLYFKAMEYQKEVNEKKDKKTAKKDKKSPASKDSFPISKDGKPWYSDWVYVTGCNEFFNGKSKSRYSREVFNSNHGRSLISPQDIADGKSKSRHLASDYALNVAQIPIVPNYVYKPGAPKANGKAEANLYKQPPLQSNYSSDKVDKEKFEEMKRLMDAHAEWLLPNDYERSILLSFLSHQIQFPGKKINWAIVLQSADGAGKTFYVDVMRRLLGDSNVSSPNHEIIASDYTDWAEGAQLIGIEEIWSSGHNRHSIVDKLKTFITNKVVSVNIKHKSMYHIANVANYLLLTNHLDALALELTDRRFCILFSAIQSKKEATSREADYFDNLYDLITDSPTELYHYFMTYSINSDINFKKHPPHTTAKDTMTRLSYSTSLSIMRQALEDCSVKGSTKDIVSSHHLFNYMLGASGISKGYSAQLMSKDIVKLGYRAATRFMHNKERHTAYVHTDSAVQGEEAAALLKQQLIDADTIKQQHEEEHRI